jgi:hypothetical protein
MCRFVHGAHSALPEEAHEFVLPTQDLAYQAGAG